MERRFRVLKNRVKSGRRFPAFQCHFERSQSFDHFGVEKYVSSSTTTTTTDDDVLVATSNATSTGTEGLCAGMGSYPIGVRLERLGGAGNSRYYRVTFETTPPVSVLVAMEDGLGGINLNQPFEIGGVTSNVTVRGTIKINGDVSATSTSEVAGRTCVFTITGQGVRASR